MNPTRRELIKAMATVPFILPSRIWAAETAPSDRLGVGFIGMGIQSRGLLRSFLYENVQVLAHSYSLHTEENEPILMLIPYGEGEIFHIPLGHFNDESVPYGASLHCVGFQTVLARGTDAVGVGDGEAYAVDIGLGELARDEDTFRTGATVAEVPLVNQFVDRCLEIAGPRRIELHRQWRRAASRRRKSRQHLQPPRRTWGCRM